MLRSRPTRSEAPLAPLLAPFLGLLVLSSALGPGCAQAPYAYEVPEQTGDGWETASLDDVGIAVDPLVQLIDGLQRQNDSHVEGLVIIKDGKLVFEHYFSGRDLDLSNGFNFAWGSFSRDTPHSLASCSKSFTSALVGMAIDSGAIAGVEERVYSIFPRYLGADDNPAKAEMTLEDLLTMSSGLPWDESSYPYGDPRNDLTRMFNTPDPIGVVLRPALVSPPGTRFHYSSGSTNALGEVVRQRTGQTLAEFARKRLFGPLGITSFSWTGFTAAPNVVVASSNLYLRPRDMAKLGELYLRGGVWQGARIVSEAWVRQSTAAHIRLPASENPFPGLADSYGYQWWRGTFAEGNTQTYFAAGLGGQYIFVMPGLELVVVITAGSYEGEPFRGFYDIINGCVLPAVLG